MITFNTILAKTLAGTIIEIIVLLLVAGLIGFFTSYYYYRGIYRRKISKLEGDLKDLQIKNTGLHEQIDTLKKELEEKESGK
jgi:uncharacterized membrane protein (DUF106 family)